MVKVAVGAPKRIPCPLPGSQQEILAALPKGAQYYSQASRSQVQTQERQQEQEPHEENSQDDRHSNKSAVTTRKATKQAAVPQHAAVTAAMGKSTPKAKEVKADHPPVPKEKVGIRYRLGRPYLQS